jgi:tetratricopeptide (TPR) repeat protein
MIIALASREANTMSGERALAATATPDQTFQRALAYHQKGRLRAANRLYRAVLAADHRHFDTLLYLGVLRLQQGNADEAARLIGDALAQNPHSAEAHANLGSALQALERYDAAIECYERALALNPDLVEANYGLATVLQTLRRYGDAIKCYEVALAIKPGYAEVTYGLATAHHALLQYDEAIRRYEAALAIDPDFAEASCGLATTLAALGRQQEAILHYQAALTVDGDYFEARCGLAVSLYHAQDYAGAAEHCRRALALEPNDSEALINLGNAVRALERYEEAVACYKKVLGIAPDMATAHFNLGNALHALERHEEALAAYDRALAFAPALTEARINCAGALKSLNRHDEAIAHCKKALADCRRSETAYNMLGKVLQELGRLDEAYSAFEAAIAIAPRRPGIYLNLFNCRKLTGDEPHLAALVELSEDAASLSEDERIALEFALGKAYSDVGQNERSFRHLLAGNAARRRQLTYDEASELQLFDRARQLFTAALIRQNQGLGNPSPVPVFVVGMMRSGTTLVEQILASHSRVFGAGERKDFANVVKALGASETAAEGPNRPLDGAALYRLGTAYLAAVTKGTPLAERIIDKMPANFRFVPLIHLALPNARIIHTHRDPVDTCLSCFSQLFNEKQPFTYDLGELGRYYRAYQTLMEHWHRALPDGVILDVRYEELVTDFETQVRRIVAHCGLEWDDACLSFYETRRPVKTASVVQVRQPIYRSSIGRWRPDSNLLRPLLEALGARG